MATIGLHSTVRNSDGLGDDLMASSGAVLAIDCFVGASPTLCDPTGVDHMCIMHFWLDIVLFLSVS